MVAALRLHALGAGSAWHREGLRRGATRGSPISQGLRLARCLDQSLLVGPSLKGGGSSRKLAVRPTGGSAPEAPCRARCNAPASEGGACCRLTPPKERQRRSRRRHFFSVANAFERTLSAIVFLGKLSGKKSTGIRLINCGRRLPRAARVAEGRHYQILAYGHILVVEVGCSNGTRLPQSPTLAGLTRARGVEDLNGGLDVLKRVRYSRRRS